MGFMVVAAGTVSFAEAETNRSDASSVAYAFANALAEGNSEELLALSDPPSMGSDVELISVGQAPKFNRLQSFELLALCASQKKLSIADPAPNQLVGVKNLTVCEVSPDPESEPVQVTVRLMGQGETWKVMSVDFSTQSERDQPSVPRGEEEERAAEDAASSDPTEVVIAYAEALLAKDYLAAARLSSQWHSSLLLGIARDGESAFQWDVLDLSGLWDCIENYDRASLQISRDRNNPLRATANICPGAYSDFDFPIRLLLIYDIHEEGWRVDDVN